MKRSAVTVLRPKGPALRRVQTRRPHPIRPRKLRLFAARAGRTLPESLDFHEKRYRLECCPPLDVGHGAGSAEGPGMTNNNRKASSEILWRLATNLRRLRKERGYTQERLAKLCGFTKNYISNVEQATVNISLANLEALTRGLNCSMDELLSQPRNRQR